MKRIVSILLSLLLIIMATAATASAESVVTVSRGATVSLKIYLEGTSGYSAKIGVTTNSAPITFVSATGGSVNDTVPPQNFSDYFDVVNGDGITITPDGTGISGTPSKVSELEDGHVGTLTFKVNTNAAYKTYTLNFTLKSGSGTVRVERGSISGEGSIQIKVTDRIPGDANDDGSVTAADALLTLKYAANWDVEINLSNADVTADGNVTAVDALNILKYVAQWDIVLY